MDKTILYRNFLKETSIDKTIVLEQIIDNTVIDKKLLQLCTNILLVKRLSFGSQATGSYIAKGRA